jgi:hypothetical protein
MLTIYFIASGASVLFLQPPGHLGRGKSRRTTPFNTMRYANNSAAAFIERLK